MKLALTLQPIQVYSSEQTTLTKLLQDMQYKPFAYGLIVGKFSKLEGFFSSFELLQYCLKVGLEHIEDVDHLRLFAKQLNQNYTVLSAIPSTFINLEENIELLIIKQSGQYIGCINRMSYLNAVAKMQQRHLRHYETIFQAMPSGVIAVDIEGRIMMMNRAGEQISGVPYEKAIGQFITDVVPPKGLLQVLQTGQGQIEKYKVRKRWYISYREPIYDRKQLVGAVGVFDDISKMEALTSDLETYRQLLRENEMLLNTSHLGVAVMDTNGEILRQNERFQHLYLSLIYDDYQRSQFRNTFQRVVNGIQKDKSIHIQTKQQRWLKCRFSSIQGAEENSIDRIIVQVEDITSEREQQQKTLLLTQHLRHFFTVKAIDSIPISDEFEERLQHIAKVNAPVLLIGDRGTGRSVTARHIIRYSERHMMPFIEIDCTSYTKNQLEQLFFNVYNPPPLLTLAAGGTLFIKNIDYLPAQLQEKFIHMLEKLNGLNIRLITSISSEPSDYLNEQLYYSINAIRLMHPPLRERPQHTKEVIMHLLRHLCDKHNRQITLPEESLTFLMNYSWVANFHSIQMRLEHYCLHLKADIWHPQYFQAKQISNTTNKPIIVNTILPLKDAVNEVEKALLILLMEQNISYRQMAKILEVNPSTIVRKIRKTEVELHGK